MSATRQRGLESAHHLLQHALADSTRDKQNAAAAELAAWLEDFGEGNDLTSCTPEELLIYVMEH